MSEPPRRAFVPVLLFTGSVAAVVSSLGVPLIPEIARNLDVGVNDAQWALTATLVVAACLSPLVGQLGDGRHRTRLLQIGLGIVVAGCVIAAVSHSLPLFVAGRGLQGFGIALMPLTMAAARDHLPREHGARTIAGLSVVGVAGVGLGYPITGAITDHGGLAAAYWFGAGVSATALLLVRWAVPAPAQPRGGLRADVAGAILIGAGLVALLVALDHGADWGWGSTRTPALIATGLVVIAVWVAYELRITHPLVDLRLLRHRAVLAANLAGLLLGVTFYVSMVVDTQIVQEPSFGFGASILVTGLTLLPLSVVSAAASRTLPWLERRFGVRPIIPVGGLVVALASVFFGLTLDHLWQAFVAMGILGLGFGWTFAAIPGLIVGAVPRDQTSSAMGIFQVARFVGFATGSGVAITLLRAFGEHARPTLDAYRATSFVGAGLAVATAAAVWLLTAPLAMAAPDKEVDALEVRDGMLAAAGLEDLT